MTQIKATLIDSMGPDRSVAYASKLEELKAARKAADAADAAYDDAYDAAAEAAAACDTWRHVEKHVIKVKEENQMSVKRFERIQSIILPLVAILLGLGTIFMLIS